VSTADTSTIQRWLVLALLGVIAGVLLAIADRIDDALDRPVRLVCEPTECEVQ
jgi:hypothetical protein